MNSTSISLFQWTETIFNISCKEQVPENWNWQSYESLELCSNIVFTARWTKVLTFLTWRFKKTRFRRPNLMSNVGIAHWFRQCWREGFYCCIDLVMNKAAFLAICRYSRIVDLQLVHKFQKIVILQKLEPDENRRTSIFKENKLKKKEKKTWL